MFFTPDSEMLRAYYKHSKSRDARGLPCNNEMLLKERWILDEKIHKKGGSIEDEKMFNRKRCTKLSDAKNEKDLRNTKTIDAFH